MIRFGYLSWSMCRDSIYLELREQMRYVPEKIQSIISPVETMKKVKWGRATIAGLVVNLASFMIGGGGYFLFGHMFRLEPAFVWRWTPDITPDMSLGWWVYLIIGNTALAIMLAFVYAVICPGLPGSGIKKGLSFGLMVWLIGVLPPVFTIHVLTVINGWTLLYLTAQSLVEHLVYGSIIAAVYSHPQRFNT